jgi:hypothetical protein
MGPACPVGRILGHPAPHQECSLPLASLRDGPRPPLTRGGVPGLELASNRAGRPVVDRAICVPSRTGARGSSRSATVNPVTLTCAVPI